MWKYKGGKTWENVTAFALISLHEPTDHSRGSSNLSVKLLGCCAVVANQLEVKSRSISGAKPSFSSLNFLRVSVSVIAEIGDALTPRW